MQVQNCGGDGIQAGGSGNIFLNNVFRSNGGNSISAGLGLAIGNVIHANIGLGLMGGGISFSQNVLNNNTGSPEDAGVQVGANECNGALCP